MTIKSSFHYPSEQKGYNSSEVQTWHKQISIFFSCTRHVFFLRSFSYRKNVYNCGVWLCICVGPLCWHSTRLGKFPITVLIISHFRICGNRQAQTKWNGTRFMGVFESNIYFIYAFKKMEKWIFSSFFDV